MREGLDPFGLPKRGARAIRAQALIEGSSALSGCCKERNLSC
jgi:hypothetical protein